MRLACTLRRRLINRARAPPPLTSPSSGRSSFAVVGFRPELSRTRSKFAPTDGRRSGVAKMSVRPTSPPIGGQSARLGSRAPRRGGRAEDPPGGEAGQPDLGTSSLDYEVCGNCPGVAARMAPEVVGQMLRPSGAHRRESSRRILILGVGAIMIP